MRRAYVPGGLVGLVLGLTLAACGGDPRPQPPPVSSAAPADTSAEEGEFAHDIPDPPFEDIEEATFTVPTQIDNEWLGMQPGTQRIFEGSTLENGEELPHRLEFTVTDLTKEIAGVRTVVALIRDISNGELVETEIAFYAQASDGTVWFFGEYPEVYEDGEFVEAASWLPGRQGAHAGIAMEAEPRQGAADYAQGWAPEEEWTDRAQVLLTGQSTCVAAGCYDDVLIMDEWSADEPGFKLKSYARGVGNVQVGFRGDVASRESLELVSVTQLDAEAFAEVRDEALALDTRAYDEAEEVWAGTEPAEQS